MIHQNSQRFHKFGRTSKIKFRLEAESSLPAQNTWSNLRVVACTHLDISLFEAGGVWSVLGPLPNIWPQMFHTPYPKRLFLTLQGKLMASGCSVKHNKKNEISQKSSPAAGPGSEVRDVPVICLNNFCSLDTCKTTKDYKNALKSARGYSVLMKFNKRLDFFFWLQYFIYFLSWYIFLLHLLFPTARRGNAHFWACWTYSTLHECSLLKRSMSSLLLTFHFPYHRSAAIHSYWWTTLKQHYIIFTGVVKTQRVSNVKQMVLWSTQEEITHKI